MSETKTNTALGISSVALVSVGVSHYKLNARINELEETVDCLRENLADLARFVKKTTREHEDQMHQINTSLRNVTSKVRKLEKSSPGKNYEKELSAIRSDLDSIIKSMTEGTPVPARPKPKPAPKEDDEDFDAYLDSFTK